MLYEKQPIRLNLLALRSLLEKEGASADLTPAAIINRTKRKLERATLRQQEDDSLPDRIETRLKAVKTSKTADFKPKNEQKQAENTLFAPKTEQKQGVDPAFKTPSDEDIKDIDSAVRLIRKTTSKSSQNSSENEAEEDIPLASSLFSLSEVDNSPIHTVSEALFEAKTPLSGRNSPIRDMFTGAEVLVPTYSVTFARNLIDIAVTKEKVNALPNPSSPLLPSQEQLQLEIEQLKEKLRGFQ